MAHRPALYQAIDYKRAMPTRHSERRDDGAQPDLYGMAITHVARHGVMVVFEFGASCSAMVRARDPATPASENRSFRIVGELVALSGATRAASEKQRTRGDELSGLTIMREMRCRPPPLPRAYCGCGQVKCASMTRTSRGLTEFSGPR